MATTTGSVTCFRGILSFHPGATDIEYPPNGIQIHTKLTVITRRRLSKIFSVARCDGKMNTIQGNFLTHANPLGCFAKDIDLCHTSGFETGNASMLSRGGRTNSDEFLILTYQNYTKNKGFLIRA